MNTVEVSLNAHQCHVNEFCLLQLASTCILHTSSQIRPLTVYGRIWRAVGRLTSNTLDGFEYSQEIPASEANKIVITPAPLDKLRKL